MNMKIIRFLGNLGLRDFFLFIIKDWIGYWLLIYLQICYGASGSGAISYADGSVEKGYGQGAILFAKWRVPRQ